jgi:hypothetical protein
MGDGDWDDRAFWLALSPWFIGLVARFMVAFTHKKYVGAALSLVLSFVELLIFSPLVLLFVGSAIGIPALVLVWGGAYLLGIPADCLSIFGWVLIPSVLTWAGVAVWAQAFTPYSEYLWTKR